jgi:hypothetical protein
MPRFITVGEAIIDTAGKAWATDYGKRSDGLFDVRMVVDGFVQSIVAFGVDSPGDALAEIQRQLSIPGHDVDIREIGTGEQHAPSIIRPEGVDASRLLKV